MHLVCPECARTFTIPKYQEGKRYGCPHDKSVLKIKSRLHEIPVRLGSYRIEGEIARGGMGMVYKGRQEGLDRFVAIKMMIPGQEISGEMIARMKREARAAGRLTHPNIVAIHEVGEHEEMPFFTMDFVPGRPLDKHAKEISLEDRVRILRDTARAIHYAHGEGIVHRDLKPANIMVDTAGTAKILDFGLAKDLDSKSMLSVTGEIMGTPAYMAPEQAQGKKVGPSADVYALGGILYFLLTGAPPFSGGNPVQCLYNVVFNEPKDPRKVVLGAPDDLAAVCLKALAKAEGERYPDAGAMADELDRYLRGESVLVRPPSLGLKLKRKLRRHRVPAMITGAGLVLALAVLMIALLTMQSPMDLIEESLRSPASRGAAYTKLLQDFDTLSESGRKRALGFMKRYGGARGEEALRAETLAFLDSRLDDPLIRDEVVPTLLTELVESASEEPLELRVQALNLGRRLGAPEFIPAARGMLRRGTKEERCAAVEYFHSVPDVAVFEELARLTLDPACGERAGQAVDAMYSNDLMRLFGVGGKGIGRAIGDLRGALDKQQDALRKLTEARDGKPKDEVDLTLEQLRSKEARDRIKACYELGRFPERRVRDALVGMLKDAEAGPVAAHSLLNIGAGDYKESLMALLSDPSSTGRANAARVLGRLGDPAMLPALNEAYKKEKDAEVEAALFEAMSLLKG